LSNVGTFSVHGLFVPPQLEGLLTLLPALRDVDHVRPLTKADMQSFFNTYISPQSSKRAKLSVHLLAQSSPSEIAKSMSPEDQAAKVFTLLTQFFNANGVSVDQEALKTRLESTSLGNGEDGVIEAARKYLKEDAKVDDEKTKKVLEEGKAALKQAMPNLGIEPSPPTDQEAVASNGDAQGKQNPAVEIKNVVFWKAGLEVSKGARPVTDLSEFEELEPKL
jgi:insulysin